MKIFDRSDLLERLGDDEEFCKEIIELFIDDTPNQIKELKIALEKKDASTVHRRSHAIKGSSANTSALSMQEVASQMETAGKNNNLDSVAALLFKFEEEFEKFKKTVNDLGILTEDDN
ncbi:Hpt domain-containing protein [Candidatus Latescibacterota bacterium]